MKKPVYSIWIRSVFFLFLLLGDVFAISLSGVLAYLLRIGIQMIAPIPEISAGAFLNLWWVVPITIFSLLYNGLYVKRLPFWEESRELVVSVLFAFLIAFALFSLAKIHDFSRLLMVLWLICAIFVLPAFRYLLKGLLMHKGIYRDNLIIIGVNDVAIKAGELVLKEKTMGYNLVGFLDDSKTGEEVNIFGRQFKVISKVNRFARIKKLYNIGVFMVALPDASEDDLVDLVNSIHRISSKILLVPPIRGIAMFNAQIIPPFMESLLLVHLRNNLLYKYNKVLKRILDIVMASLALLFLSPFMLIISVLIKLTSKGPVFFMQRRLGYNGEEFMVYKFRSMYEDAEKRLQELLQTNPLFKEQYEKNWKVKDDPRVTPVGAFLRRWSLDELPQLFNVLKGEMSIVGPRPYLPRERHTLKDIEKVLFMVRPGITGLWQVSGRSDTDYKFRVETDVWYVLNWSPWLDLMILAKTVWVVLRGKGAY